MKKLKAWLLALTVSSVAFAAGGLAACKTDDSGNNGDNNGGGTDNEQSQYVMKITAIGSTTIQVDKTLTLRTQVTGTNRKDVTWSSLNPEIATVSEKGVVTGVSAGEATIKATLDIDDKCTATIKVTVEPAVAPDSVTVKGAPADNTGWVGETTQLSVGVTPENASLAVNWTTSDESVATVSADGLVSYKKKGDVTVTATSKADDTKKDSVTLVVREGVFNTQMGSNWDFSYQDDATEPRIVAQTENMVKERINTAYFANYRGTKFYAEVTFTGWAETANGWDWQGFGLGAGLADNDSRYFTFSPHYTGQTGNNFHKIIVRDNPNSWGAITTRSQLWGARGLNSFNPEDGIKIGMLRDGNEYYYYLNDELYYFDNFTKYNNEATIPFVVNVDMAVTATDYKLVTDGAQIDAKIAETNAAGKSFYANNPDKVDYVNDSDFTFKTQTFSKDNEVRTIGDKAVLMNGFSVEFDVDSMALGGGGQRYKGLSVNLSRYDSADTVETLGVGVASGVDSKSDGSAAIGRYFQWEYPKSADGSPIANWYETSQPVLTDSAAKHHVRITRTVDAEAQISYFRMFIDGEEYVLDTGKKGGGGQSNYIGSYILWISGEYASAHVSNFKYESDVPASELPAPLTVTAERTQLEVKDTLQLTASASDVTYLSLNPQVATVTAGGLVTALTSGDALIVVTATVDGITVKATVKITVEEPATLTILNEETELWPNETITLRYEFSKETLHSVVFESSDEGVATVDENGVISPVADGKVVITVRDAVNGDIFDTLELDVITALKLKITNEMLYIETGATAQLKYKFTYDAGHEVSFTTSDPAIAAVSDTGLITAIATGDVVITVTSKTDANITASATFHIVDPLSLEITTERTDIYLTGDLQVTYAFSYPAGHSVAFESSDDDIATVSSTGLVTAHSLGSVTITVRDENGGLSDTITLTVKDLILDHAYQADMWDYAGVASDTPVLETKGEDPDGVDYVAVFKNVSGQRYYAEATVQITNAKSFVWAGVGLGSKAAGSDRVRSIIVSAQTDKANRPIIIKEGKDNWDEPTGSSQVHHWKGLAAGVDNAAIKLGILRDGSDYYYFVNGVLVWLDGKSDAFVGVDTSPVIRMLEAQGRVTGMYATTDSSVIDEKLDSNKFVAIDGNVEVKDDGSIAFKNDALFSIDNNSHVAKDYGAVSTLRLAGGKDTKVEFDIKIDSFGEGDKGLLGMTLRDTGALAYKSARSFLIGKTQFGFSGWEFGGGIGNAALGAPSDIPEGIDMADGGTHRVTVERVNGVGYRIILDGNANAAVWNYDVYANDMLISFNGTTVSGTISNIRITDL